MARVLSAKGFIHLEAPNYQFPYEPHLGIVTFPLLGKWFVKVSALFQGKWAERKFLDHLNFVTPAILESQFEKNGLYWKNRALDKLKAASKGGGDIRKYRTFARILNFLSHIGLSTSLIKCIGRMGFYPSVLYTLHK